MPSASGARRVPAPAGISPDVPTGGSRSSPSAKIRLTTGKLASPKRTARAHARSKRSGPTVAASASTRPALRSRSSGRWSSNWPTSSAVAWPIRWACCPHASRLITKPRVPAQRVVLGRQMVEHGAPRAGLGAAVRRDEPVVLGVDLDGQHAAPHPHPPADEPERRRIVGAREGEVAVPRYPKLRPGRRIIGCGRQRQQRCLLHAFEPFERAGLRRAMHPLTGHLRRPPTQPAVQVIDPLGRLAAREEVARDVMYPPLPGTLGVLPL